MVKEYIMEKYGLDFVSNGIKFEDVIIVGVDALPIYKNLYNMMKHQDTVAARKVKLSYLWLLTINEDWFSVKQVMNMILIQDEIKQMYTKLDVLNSILVEQNEVVNKMIKKIDSIL